jgi:7,8-dihydropterin-6-yl-methyl-4-(beta-D-ribofuranosyl)aminobenzene 5'-phosphate synthase
MTDQNPAAKPQFAPPVVDSLAVRVVVDSHHERFMPEQKHAFAKVEHMRQVPQRQYYTLACEWGLALHLESRRAGASAQYMLDFGFTPEIVNRNFDLIGIEPDKINGLILSHGHRDHFGGMDGFVRQFRTRMKPDLSLYVGGEDIFREKWINGAGNEIVSWGVIDRVSLAANRVKTVCCPHAHAMEQAFTTGFIPRNSFEKVSGGSMVEEYDHFTEAERKGKLVQDQHPDEHATCYVVQGRGLVVITSCGHVGLINTLKAAMAVSNVDKLHAVLGGFHLATAPPEYIDQTVRELKALQPDVVVPMHCSGWGFIDAMKKHMPEQLVSSTVGSRFTFGV